MYITTFYSFKGGVGRTMALVNSAVELARRGRRVLAVDFDIEAPGLDTFDALQPSEERPGIVDFVVEYLRSERAPNASDFISECPAIGDQGGKLWVMSSGRKESYSANFNQVNWGELYDLREGYLLFEDLKAQWKHHLNPDYVLIDSRTGHTDTSGICTRQLPDSVVVLFFPNEQNLRGLAEVVGDIRSEGNEPRKKNIELHFVMSNVPDLDDEDRILERKLMEFKRQLDLWRDPIVVHRYDSLSLLNQVIFTKDRPRSRLAKEYQEIVRAIISQNYNDRDGALDYIKQAHVGWWEPLGNSIQKTEEKLAKIEKAHADDGEVLYYLAELNEHRDQPEAAAMLVDQAINAGYDHPSAYAQRAQFLKERGDLAGVTKDFWHVLRSNQVSPPIVRNAIRWLQSQTNSSLEEISESTAVRSLELDDKIWLADTFNRSRNDLQISASLFEKFPDSENLSASARRNISDRIGLAYMGLGRCSEAATMFRKGDENLDDLGIADAFNFGMARWGISGTVDAGIFRRVVELGKLETEREFFPNYLQCMAISHWALGDGTTALDFEHMARKNVEVEDYYGKTEFSCWRYLQVSTGDFLEDLNEIRSLIEGDDTVIPRFMRTDEV